MTALLHDDRRRRTLPQSGRQDRHPAGRRRIFPPRLPPRCWRKIIFILLAVSLAAACTPKPFRSVGGAAGDVDITTTFTGDWRSYYERGRQLAAAGFQAEAMADFRRAVEERSQDQWRIETSDGEGLDYFPHRELGILYFQRREFDRAIVELEHSIAGAPSARAHYFINRARAAKIERDELDRTAPELSITATSAEAITSRTVKAVKGVASDDNFLASITVAQQEVDMELAVNRKIFTLDTELKEGANRIRVAASDLAGKTTEQFLDVYCDRRGPRIEIEHLSVADNQVYLQGNVSDERGLASLRINNERWPVTGHAAGYNFRLTLPDAAIFIDAADRAGNNTRAVIREDDAGPLSPQGAGTVPSAEHPAAADGEPPDIRITGPGPDEETYAETVVLQGMISDASLLIHISIDGEPVDNRKGSRVYFSQLKKLAPGANTFHIVAADEYGHTAGRKITVHRRIPAVRQIGSRMAVAVLPFAHAGGRSDTSRRMLNRSLSELGRFRIVTESKIDAVLRELNLDSGRPVDREKAVLVGRQVGSQAVLTGSVTDTPQSVEIIARLIDVETGTILAANDVFGMVQGPDSLDILADSLAGKFARDLPLAEGLVIGVSGNEVVIDAGTEADIKAAMELICYREAPPARHPVTGRPIITEPQVLAILKVTDVERNRCRAEITGGNPGLMVSDRVIAR